MVKLCSRIVMALIAVLVVLTTSAGVARSEEATPEEILKRYLTATQNQKFDDAYELVSKAMKTDRKSGQVKSKEVWSKDSQDKFLNQLGVEEYELYTLVKEDGGWKVDSQQEVIEPSEIAKWFPKKNK